MENGIEKKILEEMAARLVANKSEIVDFISRDKEVSGVVIDSITKSLVQRGLLTEVYSSTMSFAITKKGIRESFVFKD